MRSLALAALIALSAVPARADVVDCRDYMVRYDGMMREVAARAPGNETDARREKAEELVRTCREEDRRAAREAAEDQQVPALYPQDCMQVGGRLVCR